MKKNLVKAFAFSFAIALFAPASLLAQKEEKDKEVKEQKEKKDVQQIIITRKNDKADKVVVEINGDKITVNGKPLDEYKDKDGDISVRLQKYKEMESLSRIPEWAQTGIIMAMAIITSVISVKMPTMLCLVLPRRKQNKA
jgi:serine protease Do